MAAAEAVVLTGAYGTGKSSAAEEIAGILAGAGVPYAALDLDWLWWFDGDLVHNTPDGALGVLGANLGALVGNYLDVGVERFVMAWAVRDEAARRMLADVVPFPVRIARLTAPIEVIRRRLGDAATAERARDRQVAERWLAEGVGAGIGERIVDADRAVAEVAGEILDWLGWL